MVDARIRKDLSVSTKHGHRDARLPGVADEARRLSGQPNDADDVGYRGRSLRCAAVQSDDAFVCFDNAHIFRDNAELRRVEPRIDDAESLSIDGFGPAHTTRHVGHARLSGGGLHSDHCGRGWRKRIRHLADDHDRHSCRDNRLLLAVGHQRVFLQRHERRRHGRHDTLVRQHWSDFGLRRHDNLSVLSVDIAVEFVDSAVVCAIERSALFAVGRSLFTISNGR
jgi:hypothetical protein